MRRLLATSLAVSLIVAIGLVLVGASSREVHSETEQEPPTPPDAPPPGVIFNDPTGSKERQYALIAQLNRGINAAPRGSTITMAQYMYDMSSTTEALLRADARGVRVQVLVDGRAGSSALTKLRKGIGTDRSMRSFVATCQQSCMSTVESVMHAKFFLFSSTGTQRHTSMITSANPHKINTEDSWNNLHTIAGDAAIYNSLRRYFIDMLADKTNPRYYRSTSSGNHKLYLFPREVRRSTDIVQLDVLDNVSCTKVSQGYGHQGRTHIRVAVLTWTGARANLARQLWKLHDQGCQVEVITNKRRVGPTILPILLQHSERNGRMKVYDAWVDRDRDDKPERYVHDKVVTVNGRWFGQGNIKVVYTGSQNFTNPGTTLNNDLILRVRHDATYDAYGQHLDNIRRHAKQLY